MPIYDLEPGVLIETDDEHLLDEEELAQARDRHAGGVKLERIAKDLGARPFSAPAETTRHVAVDYDALVDALGPERAAELLGSQPAPSE